jgi:hypothetical protein
MVQRDADLAAAAAVTALFQPDPTPNCRAGDPETYPAVILPPFSESRLKDSLRATHRLSVMWIDDSSADVIKADFEALYHGDMLVEGETSEQFEDSHQLPTAS